MAEEMMRMRRKMRKRERRAVEKKMEIVQDRYTQTVKRIEMYENIWAQEG